MSKDDDTLTQRFLSVTDHGPRVTRAITISVGREAAQVIGLGSDHNGFALKQKLLSFLVERGEEVHDFGTFSDAPVDYPDIAAALAEAVRDGLIERAILVCGTGLGMAIAANKVPGAYAAPVVDACTARKARESNGAQIITLGAQLLDPPLAFAVADAWLKADFRGGDSARKVAKIRSLEERYASSSALALARGGQLC